MLSTLAPGYIGILSQFDIAFSAQNEQPNIAPGIQAIRREPIDADITQAAVAAYHNIGKVLQFGALRMLEVSHLRTDNLRFSRPGKKQKLIQLVRRNIRQ